MVAVVTPAIDDRITRAARGDQHAAEALLLELLPRARNLVRYLVRSDAEVDDLVQEALVAVFLGLPTFRGEGRFEAWADRIVARTVFAHVQRQKKPIALEELAQTPADARAELGDEYVARRQTLALLDELPYDQRAALVLHHALEMSVPEIAKELAVPEETVRSRLRLGSAKLRKARGGAQ